MGTREMPKVADFLTILPVTPELVRKLGYLPQCTFWDGKPELNRRGCGRQSEWTVQSNYHCTAHKDEIVQLWEGRIADWVARPAKARDEDLDLLEIVREELESRRIEVYPGVAVARVVKDLSLPDTPEGRNLASWYLYQMGIFTIHQRVGFFEDAITNEQS